MTTSSANSPWLSEGRAQRWPDLRDEDIVYEDEDVLVVNKPAGVSCQAADPNEPDDLPARLRRFLAARRGVAESEVYVGTHQRLDQDTSGLVLYTLRTSANASIAEQLEGRSVEKSYLVGVCVADGNAPRDRELAHALAPDRDGRMAVTSADDRRGKQARTRIKTLQHAHGRALIEATIETGRTHQIRVQLAHIGLPVAGDVLYGGAPALRLMLHAHRLVFRQPTRGELIELRAPQPFELGDWLAHGARPAYRDPQLLACALRLALDARFALGRAHAAGRTTTFRLLHESADGFPDLGAEVYGEWLVLRVLGNDVAASEVEAVLDALHGLGFAGIYLKRHPKQGNELGDPHDEQVAPSLPARGEPAPEVIEVVEQGVPFEVRLYDGLRTGLFLDQRENRARIRELASGKRVLNLFSYTGSFSVAALAGGASSAVSVDVSRAALRWAERNVERIGATARHRVIADDTFSVLAALRARAEQFDVVIVDPPSYSTSKRGRFRVTKDYASLCAAAFSVLAEEGCVLACLNHHGVSQNALRRFVHEAARVAGAHVESLKDLATQRDFPADAGAEPLMKSVLVRVSRATRERVGRQAGPRR